MSLDETRKLQELADKIKFDTATKEEYEEYYNILIESGISKNTIDNQLANGNFKTITDLYLTRKNADEERKRLINRNVVSGLVGIGLGVLLYWSFKGGKK